jgi:hypothetical protein
MLKTTLSWLRSQTQEDSMNGLYYIGLDVHKKHVSYGIKTGAGDCIRAGQVAATRAALSAWAATIDQPWRGALGATLFSAWIYDHLRPYAEQLQVAHPAMLEAITCSKKKTTDWRASREEFP